VSDPLPRQILRLADLAGRSEIAFALDPDAPGRAALAAALGIPAIRKFRFQGKLTPLGRRDWQLEAELGATVVQDCVVTLAPVTTRIDESVRRSYMAGLPEPGPGEIEMPEDDNVDPLPATLDLYEVALESLSLALPPFPRAEGAALAETVVTEPGADPMTQEKAKPFSGLEGLKKALEKKGDPGE
jgi:uncharacterized metal-binding protein YceD (DUF177 family)